MSEPIPTSHDPIDRVAPTRRPDRRVVMYHQWRSLLFLHWEVDPAMLRAKLPRGLELDTFEGRAYIGLVPFTMRGIRPAYLPSVPWLSSFHETNLRTYVHVEGKDPGVWFLSLDAANPIAVIAARSLFHLPYHHARMQFRPEASGIVHYASWRLWPSPHPAVSDIRARPTGSPSPAPVGTFEHFVLERYFLYATDGIRLYREQVHHPPYPAQTAEVLDLEESILRAGGVDRPSREPIAHFASGVDVEIFPSIGFPAQPPARIPNQSKPRNTDTSAYRPPRDGRIRLDMRKV